MGRLSSMIAWYARRPGMDERKTARHFKVSIHTVRDAVQAWTTVETFGPVLKQAEETIRKIDRLAPAGDDWRKAEAFRLRLERRRCRVPVAAMAGFAKLTVRAYLAGERGQHSRMDPGYVALRAQRDYPQLDAHYVNHGERRGTP